MDPIHAKRAKQLAAHIERVSAEIKRIHAHLKSLREIKKKSEAQLYELMNHFDIDKVDKVSRKKIQPRPKIDPEFRKAQVLGYLTQMGVDQPEQAWKDLKKVQSAPYIRSILPNATSCNTQSGTSSLPPNTVSWDEILDSHK